MKRFKLQLLALFALQCVLAVGLFVQGQADTEYTGDTPLLSFDASQIDKILVQHNEQSLTLLKRNNTWQIDGEEALPANQEKIASVLEKLGETKASWPVATTTASHERFELTEDKHQRRVVLYQNEDAVADLYLGTSPGFRKVHARAADQQEVFAITLNTFDVPDHKDGWLDKSLLALSEAKAIKSEQFELVKHNEGWQLANQAIDEDKTFAAEKADKLVSALKSLKVAKIANAAPKEAETTTLTVSAEDNVTYDFIKKDNEHYVRRHDRTTLFAISQYDYDRIAGLTLDDLLVAKTPHTDEDTVADSSEEETAASEADS